MNQSDSETFQIINAIPTLAWSARPDGSADFFNLRWLEYTGLSAEQALGWGWKIAIHPDDLPQMLEVFQNALELGQPFEAEGRFRRNDGEFRWFIFRASPSCNESARVVRWYGTNTDIEDRKRAEDELRSNEQSFRLLLDTIPGLVCTMNAGGEVELVNRRILDYFGMTLEELKKWGTNDAVHPDDRPNALASWIHSFETGEPYDVELRNRRVDGVYRWHNTRALPQRDESGRIIRWSVLVTDIDERKKAEEALRRSEGYLADAQRMTRIGNWAWNLETGQSIHWSQEHYRLFCFDPAEDIPTDEMFFQRIHPEDRDRVVEAFGKALSRDGTNFKIDYRIDLPDGSSRYISSIGHPVFNSSGDVSEYIGTAMDVTEQYIAKAALEAAFEQIKALKEHLYNENVALRDEVDRVSMFEEIVGNSRALQAVLSRVIKVAPTDSTVLITGETGTGKELIARAIHKQSHRSQRAFVSVNCAALAPSLISSELFGHEKGAFTGATQRRVGRFELADGGTIFLDEIGELPPDTQVALLRVLQEREFERVGGTRPIQVDVRVIAATNRNLQAARANGNFRSDLYYRLNVFPLEVPPLRERRDDVLMLLEYFVHRFARKTGKDFGRIDKRTLELFRSYDWPGNIRELQNVVERSVILSSDDVFCVDEAWLTSDAEQSSSQPSTSEETANGTNCERRIIEAALAKSRGRVAGLNGAAAQLRIPPSTLESKIKGLKISKTKFKLG
jgi:PAS domain S-box-containing protein